MKRSLRILGVVACGMTLAGLFAVVIWQQTCIGRLRAEAEVLRGQAARAPSIPKEMGNTAEPQPTSTQALLQDQLRELLRLRGELGVLRRQLAESTKADSKEAIPQPPIGAEESNKLNQEQVEDWERAAAGAEDKLAIAKQVLDVLTTALKVPESVRTLGDMNAIHAINDPSLDQHQLYLRFRAECVVLGMNARAERMRADGARAALQAGPALNAPQ